MKKAIRLAVTMGDPAGIGPEIIAKTADKMRDEIAAGRLEFMVIGSAKALDRACEQVGLARDSLPLSMIDVGPVEGRHEALDEGRVGLVDVVDDAGVRRDLAGELHGVGRIVECRARLLVIGQAHADDQLERIGHAEAEIGRAHV